MEIILPDWTPLRTFAGVLRVQLQRQRQDQKNHRLQTDTKVLAATAHPDWGALGKRPAIDQKELCLNTIVNKSLRPCGHYVAAEARGKGLNSETEDGMVQILPGSHI